MPLKMQFDSTLADDEKQTLDVHTNKVIQHFSSGSLLWTASGSGRTRTLRLVNYTDRADVKFEMSALDLTADPSNFERLLNRS